MSAAKVKHTLAQAEAKLVKLNAEVLATTQRIETLKVEVAAAEAAERNTNQGANGEFVGKHVVYEYGRADKKRELTGCAIAFKQGAGKVPSQYKVQHGEGFNTEFHTVYVSQISAEATLDENGFVVAEPLPAEGAAADPLAGT